MSDLNEINKLLKSYTKDVQEASKKAAIEAAKDGVRQLKKNSPRRSIQETKHYYKGWTYKTERDGFPVVYNRDKPQLTHLLEHGHEMVTRNRIKVGEVDSNPHIKPVRDKIESEYLRELERLV